MAILITTHVKGQTAEGYDQVNVHLGNIIKTAPGFLFHAAYGANGEWHIVEVWKSKAEADNFFATNVAPNLPKGIIPKRSYQELHSVTTPGG